MFETGVPNFDRILGGGVRERDVLLVTGPPGSGKTTMTFQIASHFASSGRNAVYVSTFSEPPNQIVEHLRSFAFFDEALIGRHLFLVSAYPLLQQSLDQVIEELSRAASSHRADLVVLDGLMPIRDLHPGVEDLRAFVYELRARLSALGCTTIVTSSPSHRDSWAPELTMVDAIVELGLEDVGTQVVRRIQVRKARGLAPLLGRHSLRIDGQGVAVVPRLESIFVEPDRGLSSEKVPLGLPELDAMLYGGLPAGSTTLLAGSLGTGKTIVGLQFIAEGVRRGERGMFVGFRENPRLLIDKARAFGHDLASGVEAGLVTLWHRPPVDLVFDVVVEAVWRQVEHDAPRRLVIDSITDLQEAIVEERRQRPLMAALAGLLRGKGVTSVITKEIAQIAGPALDFSDTPLAILGENLVLLRHVELRGHLSRIVSIIKTRDAPHDHSIREYTIDEHGLQVLSKPVSAEGTLTGIGRATTERRAGKAVNAPLGKERPE